MTDKHKKRLIVVLGMHRSGTSATTRALQVLGVELGNNLMPGIAGDNEKGFWEDLDFHKLDIDILESLSHDWQTFEPISRDELLNKKLTPFRLKAIELLREKIRGVDEFGIKDPRMSRLLPFWQEIFSHCKLDVSYVIAIRNPLSVAKSLNARDKFEGEKSYYLWLVNVLPGVLETGGCTRVVLDYDQLLDNPSGEISRMARTLGLHGRIDSDELQKFEREFLDERLRHTRYQTADLTLDPHVPSIVIEVYDALLKVSRDAASFDSVEIKNCFDRAAAHVKEIYPALHYMTGQDVQIMKLKKELSGADEQHAALRQNKLERDARIESILKELDEHEKKSAILSKDIAEKGRQILDLNQSVRERDEKINVLADSISERDNQIAELEQNVAESAIQINDLKQVIADLKKTLTEREKQIAEFVLDQEQRNLHIAELNKTVTDLEGKLNTINWILTERESQIAVISNRLFDIETSLTWRIASAMLHSVQSIAPRFIKKMLEQTSQRCRRIAMDSTTVHYRQKAAGAIASHNSTFSRSHENQALPSRILSMLSTPFFYVTRAVTCVLNQIPSVRTMRSMRLVKRSKLFDDCYYVATYFDVKADGIDPLRHYVMHGWRERRNPGPLFDTAWYLQQNPDVAAAGINPLLHYIEYGAAEGRTPAPSESSQKQEAQQISFETTDENALLYSAVTAVPRQRRRLQESLPERSIIYAFTSMCLNYVPKARVLAETLKQHNPQIRFCLLINEPVPVGMLDSFDIFDEVVTIDDLDIPNKQAWIFGHTLVELCTAVKGFFMLDLLERPECAKALYFDPDIAVFSNIDVVLEALDHASILLTPHQTEPEETVETIMDNEICSLKHGVYNLGFLGVKPSAEGLRFTRWWRDRLYRFCREDFSAGLFTDQRWIDLAPAFFSEIHILRHPGCNVCTWNLTHRHIKGSLEGGFTVNGEPLIFYHFSGFDSGAQEIMLNKYGKKMPAALALRQWYLTMLERPDNAALSLRRWRYNYFSNGEPVVPEQRRLFRSREDLQRAFSDPFLVDGPGLGFYHWYKAEVLERSMPEKIDVGLEASSTSDGGKFLSGQSTPADHEKTVADARRDIVGWAVEDGPVILFVGHYGGGGTEKHIRDLARYIGKKARILLLTPQFNGSVLLTTLPAGDRVPLCFELLSQINELAEVLTDCRLERVHIHHLYGNEHYLKNLIALLGKPFDFTVHDYYTLAPNPQLIGTDCRFVGENLAANENRLFEMSVCSGRPASLSEWQDVHRWLLTDAERIIAPSFDVARRLNANIPGLNIIVAAHPEKHVAQSPIHIESINTYVGLRIAVLGQLTPYKGFEVVRKCAKLTEKNSYPLSFYLIGQPLDNAESLARAGVIISGPYNDHDLQARIQERNPHIIWFPALWPETFSYTLSAGLEARLPLAVPNLGAFPERVVGRPWTWVCPWDWPPEKWLKFFLHIRESCFLTGNGPECPDGVPPKKENFYDHEYFSWCAKTADESFFAIESDSSLQKGIA